MSTSPCTHPAPLPTTSAPAPAAVVISPSSSFHAPPARQQLTTKALELLSKIPWYVEHPDGRLKQIEYAYRNVDPARQGYEHLAEEWRQCQSDAGKAPHSLVPYRQNRDHNGNGRLDMTHAGLYRCIKTRARGREPYETSPYGPLRYIAPLSDLIDVGRSALYLLNTYATSPRTVYIVLVVVESARVQECGLDSLGLELLDWRTNDFFRVTGKGSYEGSAVAFVELFLMSSVTTSSRWRYVELPPEQVTRRNTLTASTAHKQRADEGKAEEGKRLSR